MTTPGTVNDGAKAIDGAEPSDAVACAIAWRMDLKEFETSSSYASGIGPPRTDPVTLRQTGQSCPADGAVQRTVRVVVVRDDRIL
jgi:hypothetical protein